MRSFFIRTFIVGALAALPACTADIHDNTVTIPNAKVNVTGGSDLDNAEAGKQVSVHVDVSGVFLVPPGTTPPPEHENDAAHLEFFIDSTTSQSILVTADVDVKLTIPESTPKGKHKFICRVDKADGTPTSTTFELAFTVTVSSGGGDAGSPADAGNAEATTPADGGDGGGV